MKYNTNITRLAISLMPSTLRQPVATRLAMALVTPLHHAMQQLKDIRTSAQNSIMPNSSILLLEDMLNRRFHFTDRQIRITTHEGDPNAGLHLWYHKDEVGAAPVVMYYDEEDEEDEKAQPVYLIHTDEQSVMHTVIVSIPSFLVSSTDTTDTAERATLRIINETMKTYKPAGKAYLINIYDYD